jgi:hypothetical protein
MNANLLLPEGFEREAEYRAHLAQLDADAPAEELTPPVDYALTERRTFRDVRNDIDDVRAELENLRARLSVIKHQATTVARSNIEWADASAHAQLGAYPWAKLAAAMVATFVVARSLRRPPLGAFTAAVMPLIIPHFIRRRANHDVG